jgi:hypothetical protein
LPQRDDGDEAEDADGDEHGFDNAGRDTAEREDLVVTLENREQGQGGADVRDDEEHLQKGPQQHAGVGARSRDVTRVLENGRVENEERRNGGDVGDQKEQPRDHGQQWCRLRRRRRRFHG